MLLAGLTFPGTSALGAIQPRSYFGNKKAIQAPTITKTAVGVYTVTFLSARDLKQTQPPVVNITAQDDTGTTFTLRLIGRMKWYSVIKERLK